MKKLVGKFGFLVLLMVAMLSCASMDLEAQACCNSTCEDIVLSPDFDCSDMPNTLSIFDNSTYSDGDIPYQFRVCIISDGFQFCQKSTAADTIIFEHGIEGIDLADKDLQVWFATYSSGCGVGCFQDFDLACNDQEPLISTEFVFGEACEPAPVKRFRGGFNIVK